MPYNQRELEREALCVVTLESGGPSKFCFLHGQLIELNTDGVILHFACGGTAEKLNTYFTTDHWNKL